MLKYFRKKDTSQQVRIIDSEINQTFSKVAEDMNLLRQWVAHISSKGHEHSHRHSAHLEITRREITHLNRWIDHLRQDIDHLKKYTKEASKYLLEMHSSQKHIYQKIHDLEKKVEGQERTIKRTQEGHTIPIKEDTRRTYKDMLRTQEGREDHIDIPESIAPPQVKVIDGKALNPSQEELVKLLYESDRALDYKSIARVLRKKEKSIRNLIYEIREKGIEVKDRNIGLRRKGFFLDKETKIKVSGR